MTPTIAERLAEIIELLILAIEEQFGGGPRPNRMAAPMLLLARKTLHGLADRFAAAVAAAQDAAAQLAASRAAPRPYAEPQPRVATSPIARLPLRPQGWRRWLPGWLGGPGPQHPIRTEAAAFRAIPQASPDRARTRPHQRPKPAAAPPTPPAAESPTVASPAVPPAIAAPAPAPTIARPPHPVAPSPPGPIAAVSTRPGSRRHAHPAIRPPPAKNRLAIRLPSHGQFVTI